MKNLISCLCTFLLFSNCSGQRKIEGIYKSNFAINGFFIETLKLNCDSTFILNFKGDLQNRNTYGKWTVNNRKLILANDSVQSLSFDAVTKKLKDTTIKYIIGKKLLQMSKSDYEAIKKMVEKYYKETGNKIDLPKNNYAGSNMLGKQKKYLLKRIKRTTCNQ